MLWAEVVTEPMNHREAPQQRGPLSRGTPGAPLPRRWPALTSLRTPRTHPQAGPPALNPPQTIATKEGRCGLPECEEDSSAGDTSCAFLGETLTSGASEYTQPIPPHSPPLHRVGSECSPKPPSTLNVTSGRPSQAED